MADASRESTIFEATPAQASLDMALLLSQHGKWKRDFSAQRVGDPFFWSKVSLVVLSELAVTTIDILYLLL
eukprot:SAG31_NODE_1983_length_6741_cov_6.836194_4_plen_71_part_00